MVGLCRHIAVAKPLTNTVALGVVIDFIEVHREDSERLRLRLTLQPRSLSAPRYRRRRLVCFVGRPAARAGDGVAVMGDLLGDGRLGGGPAPTFSRSSQRRRSGPRCVLSNSCSEVVVEGSRPPHTPPCEYCMLPPFS